MSEAKLKRKTSPYGAGVFTGSYKHKALTSSMDNTLTVPLSRAARKACASEGDFIDQGLVLVRELRAAGFEIRIIEPTPTNGDNDG